MPLRRKEAAAVEITALAAGAGPPANKMATRLIAREGTTGYNAVSDKDDMAVSHHISIAWSLDRLDCRSGIFDLQLVSRKEGLGIRPRESE
jgi:hypothetical protein